MIKHTIEWVGFQLLAQGLAIIISIVLFICNKQLKDLSAKDKQELNAIKKLTRDWNRNLREHWNK